MPNSLSVLGTKTEKQVSQNLFVDSWLLFIYPSSNGQL